MRATAVAAVVLLAATTPLVAGAETGESRPLVRDVAVADPVLAGGDLTVRATVENDGAAGPATVRLVAGDRVAARTVRLDAGERRTVALTWGTDADDAGVRSLAVRTGADEAGATATVADRLLDGCTTVREPGVYALTGDAAGTGTCLDVRAGDVVVDGAGHRLAGSGDGTGVLVAPSADGVRVRDLRVARWATGVDAAGEAPVLRDVTATGSVGRRRGREPTPERAAPGERRRNRGERHRRSRRPERDGAGDPPGRGCDESGTLAGAPRRRPGRRRRRPRRRGRRRDGAGAGPAGRGRRPLVRGDGRARRTRPSPARPAGGGGRRAGAPGGADRPARAAPGRVRRRGRAPGEVEREVAGRSSAVESSLVGWVRTDEGWQRLGGTARPGENVVETRVTAPGVVVLAGAGNRPPVAAVAVGAEPTLGRPVTVDASASYDPDGRGLASFAWDLDGDGAVDRRTEAPRVRHAFGAAGERTVSVRVVDADGATRVARTTVDVRTDDAPAATARRVTPTPDLDAYAATPAPATPAATRVPRVTATPTPRPTSDRAAVPVLVAALAVGALVAGLVSLRLP